MCFQCGAVLMLRLQFGLQLLDEQFETAKLVAQPLDFPRLRRRAWRG